MRLTIETGSTTKQDVPGGRARRSADRWATDQSAASGSGYPTRR